MLYQLPSGKVIELSVEDYLDMSDEDFEQLIASNYGEAIDNPFFGSTLERPTTGTIDDIIPIIESNIDIVKDEVDFDFEEE